MVVFTASPSSVASVSSSVRGYSSISYFKFSLFPRYGFNLSTRFALTPALNSPSSVWYRRSTPVDIVIPLYPSILHSSSWGTYKWRHFLSMHSMKRLSTKGSAVSSPLGMPSIHELGQAGLAGVVHSWIHADSAMRSKRLNTRSKFNIIFRRKSLQIIGLTFLLPAMNIKKWNYDDYKSWKLK